jgi:hypothetical protein
MLLLGCLSCWLVIKLSSAPLIFLAKQRLQYVSRYGRLLGEMRAITTRAGG